MTKLNLGTKATLGACSCCWGIWIEEPEGIEDQGMTVEIKVLEDGTMEAELS